MKKEKRQEIYKEILRIKGYESRLKTTQEMCNDLILTISDYMDDDVKRIEDLIDKIANVHIMIDQLSEWVGIDVIMHNVNHKLYDMSVELKNKKL